MEVKRASFNPDRQRLEAILGSPGNALQIDFVGSSAFMLRRVFEPGAEIVMEAEDDRIIFRRVEKAPVNPKSKPVDLSGAGSFRDHLERVE